MQIVDTMILYSQWIQFHREIRGSKYCKCIHTLSLFLFRLGSYDKTRWQIVGWWSITLRIGHRYNLDETTIYPLRAAGQLMRAPRGARESRWFRYRLLLARSQRGSSKSRDLWNIMRGRLSVIDYAAGGVQNESDIREGDPSRDRGGTTDDKLWRDLVFHTRDRERREPPYT